MRKAAQVETAGAVVKDGWNNTQKKRKPCINEMVNICGNGVIPIQKSIKKNVLNQC